MRIEVDGKKFDYQNGVRLSEIAKDIYGNNHGRLLAKVNGKLKELWKKVSEDSKISFYDITSADGIRTYERGVLFLFIKSVHDVFDKTEVTGVSSEYSLGNGIFCEIRGNIKINDEFVSKVRNRMYDLVAEDIMFEKSLVSTREAVEKFLDSDLSDKEHLFRYRRGSTTNIYRLGEYYDYFYGYMPPVGVSVSVTLWLMSVVCAVMAWRMRSGMEKGGIGMDRSQINPVTAAQWLVVGKASAWTGAIVSGVYAGIASFVVPRSGELVAASDDLPGVLASLSGAVALCVAGVVLERHCVAPPPPDGETA